MFNVNKNFFIFLIIVLVVSITPVSALNYKGIMGNMGKNVPQNLTPEQKLSKIDSETKQIEDQISSVENDLNYAFKRSKDYNWKFWKWPKISNDIINSLNSILAKLEGAEKTAGDLEVNLNDLKAIQASSQDDVVTDLDLDGDAKQMARNLSNDLNTHVTVNKVENSEIKEGDIVQYLSQDYYPRYLIVTDVSTSTNSTKSTRNTPILYTITLKGPGNMIFPTQFNDYTKFEFDGIDPQLVLNSSTKIQQSKLQQQQNKIKELYGKAKRNGDSAMRFLKIAGILYGIAAGLGIVTLVLIGISVPFPVLAPVAAAAVSITALIAPISVGFALTCIIIAGIYLGLSISEEDEAHKLEGQYNLAQGDLSQYTKNLPETSMNVTTFDGVPIVTHPNMTDWKDYTFTLIKAPENGDVLDGPGLQFLYGPREGCVGNDSFKFQYSKNGAVEIMTVHIDVQPIPVIPIPQGA